MSQEYNTVPKKQKRTRSQRNRPTLVTNATAIVTSPAVDEDRAAEPATTLATPEAPVALTRTTPQRSALLPRFFSKVDKGDQDDASNASKDTKVIEARMARARKGVVAGEKTAPKEETKEVAKAGAAPAKAAQAASNRPPSLFKTRHIIGMGIYLLAAQFILPYERVFAISLGIESKLAEFPFFGANASITTSFLLNIITLIVLLYLLVRFDLLPSGKKLAATQAQAGKTGAARSGSAPVEKVPPKTIREGVKGEHDDLYMAYRNSQRREKKR
ncbi:MAG: hypothetical protein PVS3B1_32160 [Ktedonobacteraceae bacterium]